MTKVQYEGTPELIFYCEYNPAKFEDRLEIPFTNEYKIELGFLRDADNQVCINVDLQHKESNIPKDFFGKNILNVTAIAGPNGVGKTNIFKGIFHRDKYLNLETIKIFKDESLFFVEKSEDIDIVSNCYIEDLDSVDAYNQDKGNFTTPHNTILFYGLPSNIKYKANRLFEKNSRTYNSEATTYYLLKDIDGENEQKVAKQFKEDFDIDISNQDMFIKFMSINTLTEIKQRKPKFYQRVVDILNAEHECQNDVYNLLFLLNMLDIYLNLSGSFGTNKFIDSADLDKSLKDIVGILEVFLTNKSKVVSMPTLIRGNIKSSAILQETFDSFFENIFKDFKKIIDECVVKLDNGCLLIDLYESPYSQSVFELIESIQILDSNLENLDKQPSLIHISIGQYSSGQREVLSLISSLWNKVLNIEGVMDLSGCQKKSVIIVIDEYEKYLHPEWIRKLFSYFMKFGIYLNIRDSRIKLQFILSTHSPYLISDLPKENIILLEKDEETGKRTARKSNYGFASNFYDILSDSFFLEGTIGEFARIKINGWMAELEVLEDSVNLQDNDERKEQIDISEYLSQLSKIKANFKIVDDPFIQQELISQCNSFEQYLFTLNDKEISLKQLKDHIADLQRMAAEMEEDNDLS